MGIVWRGLPRGGAGLAAVTCQSFVWFWLNLGCHREERRSAVVFSPLGTFGPPAGLQCCGVGEDALPQTRLPRVRGGTVLGHRLASS